MKCSIRFFGLVLLFFSSCAIYRQNQTIVKYLSAYDYKINKKIIAKNGAVVSAHPLASKAGLLILQKGGNAFDAAIAMQLALAVVYPGAGNIGGGGFLIARKNTGENIAIDYRETAPEKAFKDMYLDEKGDANTNKSTNGHLAAGIPGTIAGLFETIKHANLPMETLIEPAIILAEKGFAITESEANMLNSMKDVFEQNNTIQPVFVKTASWKKGDTLIQKDLANTLKRIKKDGQKGFYEGKTAELIVAEMKRGGGIIDYNDLKKYDPKNRTPHKFIYKDCEIIGMPMPSSGGVLLHQMMKMIEPYGLKQMGYQTAASIQLMVEAERRAFADRAKYMGDADFVKVPVEEITNEAYLKTRMNDFVPTKAGNSQTTTAGFVTGYESEETTHLNVVDRFGNAVAVTTTLNGSYGCATVVGGAGFLLNNEMDDFSVKPGTPNMYGAIGNKTNAIAPGKRMLSSMTPTIILKNKKPFLVLGTPGGTTIPTSVFQTIVNIIEYGLSTEDAVYKPKFHHQWLPDRIDIEPNIAQSVIDSLVKMGYQIYPRKAIGRVEVIKILEDGSFEAVADNRGNDDAEGF